VYVIYTDEIVNDLELSELTVFEENYALLCNIITDVNDPLIKCFIGEKFLTTEEERQIATVNAASEKLRLLLPKISTLLQTNNIRGFYIMLKIMKEHGGKTTQTLADHIMNRLKISPDKLSHICSNDVQVHNDEPKG